MHVLGTRAAPPACRSCGIIHEYVAARPLTPPRCCGTTRLARRRSSPTRDSVAARRFARGSAAARTGAVDLQRRGSSRPSRRQASAPISIVSRRCRRRRTGTIRVGLVATFARWKGHETFLRAVRRLGLAARAGPTSSADRCTTPRAASIRVDELRAMAASLGVRIASASPDSSRSPPRRCARSTSSSTPAPSRSRSAWSSPRAWRAARRSSSAPPAARRSSSSTDVDALTLPPGDADRARARRSTDCATMRRCARGWAPRRARRPSAVSTPTTSRASSSTVYERAPRAHEAVSAMNARADVMNASQRRRRGAGPRPVGLRRAVRHQPDRAAGDPVPARHAGLPPADPRLARSPPPRRVRLVALNSEIARPAVAGAELAGRGDVPAGGDAVSPRRRRRSWAASRTWRSTSR